MRIFIDHHTGKGDMKTLHKHHRLLSAMIIVAIMILNIVLAVMQSRDYYVKACKVIRHDVRVMPKYFVKYEKPSEVVDGRILIDTICDDDSESPIHCWPWRNPFLDLNCREIFPADPLLDGSSPSYPIARSDRTFPGFLGADYLYRRGCLYFGAVSYIVQKGTHYIMIATDYQLRDTFAPIESKEKALAFALARTGYKAYFGQSYSQDYEYFVPTIEDTHIATDDEGYQMNLYDRSNCGCAQHVTVQVIIDVSRDGHVTEITREGVYRDRDWICYD
jgi:hypothetical protein